MTLPMVRGDSCAPAAVTLEPATGLGTLDWTVGTSTKDLRGLSASLDAVLAAFKAAGYQRLYFQVEDDARRQYVRYGSNADGGAAQWDGFVASVDGVPEHAVQWDFSQVTKAQVLPVPDGAGTHVRGGSFETTAQLAVLDSDVLVGLAVGDGVPGVASGHQRTWGVMRVHEGEATILPATYDATTESLVFATKYFSTYATVWHDDPVDVDHIDGSTSPRATVVPPQQTAIASADKAPRAGSSSSLPKTDDPWHKNVPTLFTAGLACLAAGLALTLRGRRQ